MTYPAELTTVSVHGSFVTMDGFSATGTVTFTPSVSRITDPDDNVIMIGSAVSTSLLDGDFTIILPATDDPDLSPVFQYKVTLQIGSLPTQEFYINVPYTTGGTLELADVTPVTTPADLVTALIGPAGNTILSGTGDPDDSIGVDGDYYMDVTLYPDDLVVWGPKASGSWPGSGLLIAAGTTDPRIGDVSGAADGDMGVLASGVYQPTTVANVRTNLGLGSLATKSAVASADITDGTIVSADLSSSAGITNGQLAGSIAVTKLAAGSDTQILTTSGTTPTWADPTIPSDVTGSAAPVSGAHLLADRVWNSNPVAGGNVGWVCVSAGTPGTWKQFGTIEV